MYTDDKMNTRMRMGCTDGCDAEKEAYPCGCGHGYATDGYPVGMVYATYQRFDRIYDLDTAMKRGTVFEELDLPFECGNHSKGGCCHE